MFNKIAFFNYYLRKKRDLRKDGKASLKIILSTKMMECGSYLRGL